MNKPSFVYVTYIATTPEKLWNALIDADVTRKYWGEHRNVSDWKVGSPWRHEDYSDSSNVDIVGTVLESDPPRRLVVSWVDPDEADQPEKYSRVTYELTPTESTVKLTVTHADLEPDSSMLRGVSFGWPIVLSSLKTLLETSVPLSTEEFFKCRPDAS